MISNPLHRIMAAFLPLLATILFSQAAFCQGQPQGYEVEYLDSWPLSNQMRYVKVRITPVAKVSPDDVDFHVVAKSRSYQGNGVAATTLISIRKGDTSATGELYIPSMGDNHAIHTEIDGDLKYDRGDFAYRDYYTNFYGSQPDSSVGPAPSFVIASSSVEVDDSVQFTGLSRAVPGNMAVYNQLSTTEDFPDLADLEEWYINPTTGFGGNRKPSTINGFSSPVATAMSLESLPSKWFAYEGLGMLMITFEDLKLLSQKHPGKMLAIERWVAASGRLVVLNCGDDLKVADEALQFLGDSNAAVRENRKTTFLAREINKANLDTVIQSIRLNRNSSAVTYAFRSNSPQLKNLQSLKVVTDEDTLKNAIETGNAGDMISVEFELGQVLFVSDSASFSKNAKGNNIDRWGSLGVFLNETDRGVIDNRSILAGSMARHFGFPEFDEPPRYVFEFSILLYLLAVGPVTYFLLKRRHKLNLMFVIVPIISTLFCTTILAYAIFAEGFDTRVNLFTFTSLDQRSGRQSTSSIAHVYSGMTPSAYSFSGPTYGMVNFTSGGRIQRINWSDSGERISGGEIRARSNHQLYARSSNETGSRLTFAFESSGESASATIRNEFEVPVSAVVFWSEDCGSDEAWYCEQVDVGQTVDAKKLKFDDIALAMKEITQQVMSDTVLGAGKASRNRNRRDNTSGLNNIDQSEVATELGKAWRMTSAEIRQQVRTIEGRNYIAITERAINYENPIENAKFTTQMHVVKGIR